MISLFCVVFVDVVVVDLKLPNVNYLRFQQFFGIASNNDKGGGGGGGGLQCGGRGGGGNR